MLISGVRFKKSYEWEKLTFSQADGKISITVPDWSSLAEDGDYIIKLKEI